MARSPGPLIVTAGMRRLQRDLRLMAPDAALEVRQVVKGAIQPIADVAASRTRRDSGLLAVSWNTSVRGASGAVVNRQPYVGPHEFGWPARGIEPMQALYGKAGGLAAGREYAERALIDGMSALARRRGWV